MLTNYKGVEKNGRRLLVEQPSFLCTNRKRCLASLVFNNIFRSCSFYIAIICKIDKD